ncbi:uncharacterized protein PV09_09105 [Verruconis gallopava]|uniref:alpha-glucosidase n=1 Tax=Verruconis gallopava TaxID=253628 RepID=A0A0D2AJW8_9PEZI|nr:uncharacterized protein PV09_09105 [Verruconis gallopava]KIV99243.1 hypothetical protein PV09_09105 [Verruconis gallopava]
MPQSEVVVKGWKASSEEKRAGQSVDLLLEPQDGENEVLFSFTGIGDGVFRTTLSSKSHPLPPWPSVHRQNADPFLTNKDGKRGKGSQQSDLSLFSSEPSFSISSTFAKAKVEWKDGPPTISIFTKDQLDEPIHYDLPHRSYVFDGPGVAHYTRYKRDALHVGLGEKAAPMDLSNRHFILSATDCFGYDIYRTDPLYKHIPLLISATSEHAVATFSTSHSRGTYSVGSEIDGMWGRYKVYRQDFGGLEEYVIVGRTVQEVIRKYAHLVGFPLLVPRWAFGYLAGGMKYSMLDEPRACDALMDFADKLKEHDIPCSGFQMSSGYTVAETEPKTRNVFTWNRHRFPDPRAFIDAYHARGIRIIANVKPYVLASHPEYERLRKAGAFFTDPRTGGSGEARLWSAGGGESGVGGHIDFTSTAGYKFWYDGAKELRHLGIDCIWNDNNEFTIPDDNWQCALESEIIKESRLANGSKAVGIWGRYLQTELMGRASHDAVVEVKPDERSFILTRAGTAGTMRYCASSWGGDNVTSWESMKGANSLSLTAGICLLQCYGHDIGGFEGPQPSPELLVRWVQLGTYSPRFAINCFKTSPQNNKVGDVIEPWMYPEVVHIVRDAIKRRYEIIPYLYSLMLRSHLYAEPPQRWVGWDYPGDGEVWTDKKLRDGEEQYFLGDALLIGGVYEPGQDMARVYLPSSRGGSGPVEQFLNLNEPYQYFESGQWVHVKSNWQDSIPVLAKVGSLIPVGKAEQTLSPGEVSNEAKLPLDDYRAVEIFPPRPNHGSSGTYMNSWLEDDGISPAPSAILEIELTYQSHETTVDIVSYKHKVINKSFNPVWKTLCFILPVGDRRSVTLKGEQLALRCVDSKGRSIFEASVDILLKSSPPDL